MGRRTVVLFGGFVSAWAIDQGWRRGVVGEGRVSCGREGLVEEEV